MDDEYKIGNLYFMVSYEDKELLYPTIDSVIYVGKNLAQNCGEDDCWYFQDTSSYALCGAFPNDEEGEGEIYALPKDGLYRILDLDGMTEELQICISRRE
jgi:hypothetical protein